MAGAKSAPPSVAYQHHDERGEHQIGVVHEGQFVPFAVLDDQTFEDAKSRAAPSEPDEEAPAEGEGGE